MSKQQQVELPAEEQNQERVERWGRLLRETRLTRGLSVEDVSNSLNFEKKLIEALEAEDVKQLPSASFVRGYLRSYSRFLDIDAEPVVQAYSQVSGDDSSVITPVAQVKEVSSKDAGPRYATWFVIVVLAVSLVIWWRSEVLLPSATKDDVAEPAIQTEIIDSLESDVVSSPELLEESITTTAPESVQAPEPEVVVDPQLSTLVLTFTADSWVEVYAAEDKRLYMDMAKAGTSKKVEGEPPFRFLFGAAPAVILEYNGEIYDHSKHNKKGVARFSLGE